MRGSITPVTNPALGNLQDKSSNGDEPTGYRDIFCKKVDLVCFGLARTEQYIQV